ncbi:MAG: tetratricopeptide repeat protein [Verrucomicrobiota bacterium]
MPDQSFKIQLLLDQGRFEEAEVLIGECIGKDAEDPLLFYLMANARLAQGHLHPAEEAVRESIRLDPESDWAHLTLSRILCEQSRFHEAETTIEKALELAPSDPDNWAQKASLANRRAGRMSAGLRRGPPGRRRDRE